MDTNLYGANRQWASRPPDERFSTLPDLERAINAEKRSSREIIAHIKDLVATENMQLKVNGVSLDPTNFAAQQLSTKLGFSAPSLAKLDNSVAANVLNHLIDKSEDEDEILILANEGKATIRSITSERYARVFNADVMPFLYELRGRGWVVPPARPAMADQPGTRKATAEDLLAASDFGLSVKEGDDIAPAGLYAGDRDMFAFMVDKDSGIDDGSGRRLMRGIFLQNSEVGAASFSITQFLMANVCGNHIVWGAENIVSVKYRHIGNAVERIQDAMNRAAKVLLTDNTACDQAKVQRLRLTMLGNNKQTVIDTIYDLPRCPPALTRKAISAAFDYAEAFRRVDGGEPLTPWGIIQGLTRYSQTLGNANERMLVDSAAGWLADYYTKN